MEDGHDPTGSAGGAARHIERVQIRRGIAGWHLVPADPELHPLLARLFGPDENGNPPGPVVRPEDRKALDWASLAEGLAEIRSAAKDCGVAVHVCGDIRQHPTLLLSERRSDTHPTEPAVRPFADLPGTYAGHWGISDFYEPHERALRAALASGAPFDTGSFGCKKEIQFGRIRRARRNGAVEIEVTAEMDEWPDLVDTAVWKSWGQPLEAGSGAELLEKLGLSGDEAVTWIRDAANREAARAEPGADRTASRSAKLVRNIGYERLCARLDALADACEAELASIFAGLVEHCTELVGALRRERGASCRFFHRATGESKAAPAEPAECGHPRYYALLSAHKGFPFEHGCKCWQPRGQGR